MRFKSLLLALASALVLAASAAVTNAQVTVNGRVTLKQADGTVVPVSGARIDIYRTDIKLEYHTRTDKKGTYTHAGIPYGTYMIIVSAAGAQPTLMSNQRFTQDPQRDFVLEPGDAETRARRVLAENPDDVDANRLLGLALLASGDKKKFKEAANFLQRYVDKAPDTHPLKQSAKEALDYLKTAEHANQENAQPPSPSRRRP